MILPTNGKVVVIDDNPEEGLALIKALSRNNISAKYFDGNPDELPDQPLKHVRIVFLDIVLGTEGQPIKTKVSKAISVLRKVLDISKTAPFILVAWTKEKNLIAPVIEELKLNKPILVDLEKYECKKDGKYDVAFIESKLKNKCGDFKSLTAFLSWENLVNNCAGEIYGDFTTFYRMDKQWDSNLKGIIYSLAAAFTGNKITKDATNKQILKNAVIGVNSVFIDTLENSVQRDDLVQIGKINETKIADEIKIRINTKMHLFEHDAIALPQTGNLYILKKSDERIVSEIILKNAEKGKDAILASKPQQIELDITPRCDYAQYKNYARLLTGVMIEKKFSQNIKKTEFAKKCPIMTVDGKEHFLIFDYRFFKSMTGNDLKKRRIKPKYRIRHELVVDIQASFSNHVNRFGVTCVD